jgi:hypothetical protein
MNDFPFNNQSSNTQTQTTNTPPSNPSSGLMQIVGLIVPPLLEHFTGQKMAPTGASPETQLILSQVLTLQQQIITNQQALSQRIVQLENNAVQQFTNLVQQVQSIKSIRLTQQKETKSIDYGLNQNQESEY